jgi:DNA-binding MarR family transcriptional regulator
MTDQNLEVARRYALARPGMTLLECEPVGLPYYWLTLDSLILQRKDKPVLEEFVLEAVHAGLDTVEDIAAFLGVDRIMIESAAAALYQADSVDYLPISQGTGRRLSLTAAGRELRESLKMVTPRRTDLYVAFDRLLWRPTDVRKPDLLHPKDAKASKLRLISPRRAKKPETDELRIEDVDKIIRRMSRAIGLRPTSCALSRYLGRNPAIYSVIC